MIIPSNMKTKHGHRGAGNNSYSPTYNSWRNMKNRCKNKSHERYPSYGGRGIKVCARWEVFTHFLEGMGRRPHGKTLDRVNVNGNYEPDNCRWATAKQQAGNKRY